MVKKSLRWDPEVDRQQEAKASKSSSESRRGDPHVPDGSQPLPANHRPTVFNLAGKDVLREKDGMPYFGGKLLRITMLHRKRGNQVIYHDLDDYYDDFYTGKHFPLRLDKHFSGAVVSKGFTMISPTLRKAARYLAPSLTLDDKTSLQRGQELAEKTPLQRGMICVRWQFPECDQVLIVKGDGDRTPEEAHDRQADYGVDTYYEVVEKDGVSTEEQTISFLCRALGSDVSAEEEHTLSRMLKKLGRQSFEIA
ncbi:hypothetical protein Z517_09274 [Fonsecaea pedrosoi CBS 271.37]|uniref:Uncharacterized protein n=1 Tax=Fonsecaea pedrosoi CBS 271.37 TaxID=1442368 RepID=A0A0D2GDT3_9EURO|nr:uncharacterized protein Z517_09274 [Fonsecaea pedrosoi CBS 271.37]KIW76830.1 hypothetical protein Z517_09274 [Fonsecaea pedrosoi CBS 271.37]